MPVTLTTPRLLLRPHRLSDAEAVFALVSDPRFGEFIPIPQPYTREDAERYLASVILRPWDSHPTFAIEYCGGAIGYVNFHIDHATRTASIGWGIDVRYWNTGFTTEAAAAVIDWAFRELRPLRIEATTDSENVASWRVMEKLGMRREGLLRKHRILRGEQRDTLLYSVLAEEWAGPPSR